MNANTRIESYEAVIAELRRFKESVNGYCDDVKSAGTKCWEKTGGDTNVSTHLTELANRTNEILLQTESIDELINALQAQMEEIRRIQMQNRY